MDDPDHNVNNVISAKVNTLLTNVNEIKTEITAI
jgi:hypothetical protein